MELSCRVWAALGTPRSNQVNTKSPEITALTAAQKIETEECDQKPECKNIYALLGVSIYQCTNNGDVVGVAGVAVTYLVVI